MICAIEIKGIITAVAVLAALGGALGILIGIFAKFFYVKPDSRVEDITALLPGANCGACGNPGCSGLASNIVNDGVDPKVCKSLKAENIEKINKVLADYKAKENE